MFLSQMKKNITRRNGIGLYSFHREFSRQQVVDAYFEVIRETQIKNR